MPGTRPRKRSRIGGKKGSLRVLPLAEAAAEAERVSFTLDGEAVEAIRGEPIAAALVASGYFRLARSPKFHRARGPSCFRAACDGCLARVDGIPNVMTCRVPVQQGTVVESQNTLGSRELDLLRMTDWVFPEGMNHHLLFAGVPGIQPLMQAFARRVAGLGVLPDGTPGPLPPARRRTVDVLVIGAGPAGMSAALAFADADRSVEVIDDALEAGGSVNALGPLAAPWERTRRIFDEAVKRGVIQLRLRTTAAAFYGRELLVVTDLDPSRPSDLGAEVLEPRTVVLATGAHDGVLPFEGNDLPGVMSARAGGWLLERGILPGKRVVVCVAPGGGPFGDAFVERVKIEGLDCDVRRIEGAPLRAAGVSRLKQVVVASTSARGRAPQGALDADALLVDAPRAPSYELCQQAGADLTHLPAGFVVRTDAGRIAPGVYAFGEVTGAPIDEADYRKAARRLAASAASDGERGGDGDTAGEDHSSTSAPNRARPPASARKSKVASKIT
jgi:sarcosine oxidase subunit alpha